MSDDEDHRGERRRYNTPYTSHRPIPTIRQYHQEKEDRKNFAGTKDEYSSLTSVSEDQESRDAANRYLYSTESSEAGSDNGAADRDSRLSEDNSKHDGSQQVESKSAGGGSKDERETMHDTSETRMDGMDPKQRRKALSKRKGDRAEREVTDPVTHLPVRIHDLQPSDLKKVPENLAAPGSDHRTATGLANKIKSESILEEEEDEMQRHHAALENMFPPPEYDSVRTGLARIQKFGLAISTAAMMLVGFIFVAIDRVLFPRAASEPGFSLSSLLPYASNLILLGIGLGVMIFVVMGVRIWMDRRVKSLWEEELWHADKHSPAKQPEGEETTHWLNSVLSSIWPLVNPDLFISLADTLEDVMQASLPSVVRMVSIEDIGQGSESIRILGVRWLPTGAAARSVGADGKLSERPSGKPNDRSVPGEGEVDQNPDDDKDQSREEKNKNAGEKEEREQVAEGMEAEEGDFINLEVAFAYRTRSSSKKFRDRAKHAHLYISFYLPGGIKVPVYVDLRGVVGIMRCRLQLTPDPPFFALATFTFLGQPSVDVACTPLTKRGLNVMDLPIISHFVQSSIDAAVAEYVAPKSMTLDLKDMLAGEDYKKDTRARGVIIVRIRRGYDFMEGDPGIPLIRDGSADPYVTVGWAKFVKPLWSTRVILSEMEPHWEETAFILVTPEELNVDERLRIQLWDSDRFTADDDLGRIELDIKEVMRNQETKGKMQDRVDGFKALHKGEGLPGKLEWSVGYFSKTHISEAQLKEQTVEPNVDSKARLQELVNEASKRKLRETKKDESKEIDQLRLQQYKEIEDHMIVSAKPSDDYPSGILSIQIHEATGLEVRAHHNADRFNDGPAPSGFEETGDELPSTYCNIILNHQKIYRTRVKPKNAKPFFNAGTERFVRDWRTSEVYVSVRDARVHEDDGLMGIVRLPLIDVFKHRSQTNYTYPLYGGVGYGRIRVSMVFRAVTSQIPRNLQGWDLGTLIIDPEITGADLRAELHNCRLKLQTSITTCHMRSSGDLKWTSHRSRGLHLGVRRRYSSCLVIQFRKDSHFVDKTSGFAVLWFCDIVDNEDQELTLTVWKGDLKRATTCYLEECGERLGTIKLKLKLWRGLSKYHHKLAKRDRHLSDVVEVVETARYQMRSSEQDGPGAITHTSGGKDHDNGPQDNNSDDSSDSSSSSSDEDGNHKHKHKHKHMHRHNSKSLFHTGTDLNHQHDDEEEEADGKRNVFDSLKEYREDSKQINRRHRGVMQFKTARTMWWMKHKVEHLQDRVSGVFEHHERGTGIESEA